LPTGTVTFLFTDVEGSTRLLRDLGAERYAEALADHRRGIPRACARTGGRAGPHAGPPLLTAGGYVGGDVHTAARVAAAAHGGQTILTAATAGLVERPLTHLREHRLKDLGEPVAILQLGTERFPPLKTISNTNLPRPASSFGGRERELAELSARIAAGARLVTLTGPGGSGKTRVAIETAASLVPSFAAGVFWIDLAPLRDHALVTETISRALGARNGLVEHIGERELLLLIDNFEQVIEASPDVAAL